MREDWSEYWAGKEKELTQTERLGLAYCRLNCWEWDDFIGEKPKDFDKWDKDIEEMFGDTI